MPTNAPTQYPTIGPTLTQNPSIAASNAPTTAPTGNPSAVPTNNPTRMPTNNPTVVPTNAPTNPPAGPTPLPTDDPLLIVIGVFVCVLILCGMSWCIFCDKYQQLKKNDQPIDVNVVTGVMKSVRQKQEVQLAGTIINTPEGNAFGNAINNDLKIDAVGTIVYDGYEEEDEYCLAVVDVTEGEGIQPTQHT